MNDHQLKRREEAENGRPLLTLAGTRTPPAAIKHIFLPQRETSRKGNEGSWSLAPAGRKRVLVLVLVLKATDV